jgi:hypothetical protein
MLAELHHDPAAAHLVRDGAGGAGAGEGVEDDIAGVGGDGKNLLNQLFRLWRTKRVSFGE